MRVLGIIPARGGSKGVPGKNIKMLGGKPLIAYTILAAQKATLVTDIILSTDSDEIIQVAQAYGLKVPFKRPASLANDESPTILTVDYFSAKGIEFDAVCLLQVTNPFRTSEFIDQAIEKFIHSNTDSLISVLKVPHEFNPHWVFEENEAGNLKISTGESEIISRRQALPTAYYRDGSIYITRTEVLLNQQSLYGKSIAYIEADKTRHVNIDTKEDWERAVALAKKLEI